MAHTLQGLLLPHGADLERLPPVAHPVLLGQDIVLVPLTDVLFDYLVRGREEGSDDDEIFWKFHPAILRLGKQVAGSRAFAYIETDYFGGKGDQAAAVWRDDKVLMAPRKAAVGPINDALGKLGVVRTRSADEFDVVGLGRHRNVEDWLEEIALQHPDATAPQSTVGGKNE